nr:hypothetical protein [Reticulibacter mediterranei]
MSSVGILRSAVRYRPLTESVQEFVVLSPRASKRTSRKPPQRTGNPHPLWVPKHPLVLVGVGRYSRYVVSWQLDQTLEMPFVIMAVQQALEQAVPCICEPRSRKPFHQSTISGRTQSGQCSDQYGRQRASTRQYFYGTIMAHS